MKKFLLLGALFFTVSAVVFFIQQKRTAVEPPRQPAPVVEAPLFPSPEVESQPTYAVGQITKAFPPAIPIYSLGAQPNAAAAGAALASALGFDAPPQNLSKSAIPFFVWTKNLASLTVSGDPLVFSYQSGASPSTKPLGPDLSRIANFAKQYLQKNSLLPSPPLLLDPVEPRFFAPKGSVLNQLPTAAGATLVEIRFNYLLENLPLFSRLPDAPSVSVILDAEGSVVSFVVYRYPLVEQASKTTPIISAKEATNRLTGGSGVLLSVSSEDELNKETETTVALSSSAINEVGLGYYYSPGKATLAPVFVFGGTGINDLDNRGIKTTTVVSALP